MINLQEYETVRLGEIASIERARKGKVYKRGSITIQVSATKGQVAYLTEDREVEPHFAVVEVITGVSSKYMFYMIEQAMDRFMHSYKTGLNIQVELLNEMQVIVHNVETQKSIVVAYEHIDKEMANIINEIETLKNLKQTMLDLLFV